MPRRPPPWRGDEQEGRDHRREKVGDESRVAADDEVDEIRRQVRPEHVWIEDRVAPALVAPARIADVKRLVGCLKREAVVDVERAPYPALIVPVAGDRRVDPEEHQRDTGENRRGHERLAPLPSATRATRASAAAEGRLSPLRTSECRARRPRCHHCADRAPTGSRDRAGVSLSLCSQKKYASSPSEKLKSSGAIHEK